MSNIQEGIVNANAIARCKLALSGIKYQKEQSQTQTQMLSVNRPSGSVPISSGSRISVGGGANSRGGYVLKIVYVKTKESGPVGARAGGAPWIRHCQWMTAIAMSKTSKS